MTNFGTACRGCSGEDCICCEVFIESRHETFEQPEPDEFELDAQLGDDDLADPGEMDGDLASGLASVGFGTAEDYGDFGGGWDE